MVRFSGWTVGVFHVFGSWTAYVGRKRLVGVEIKYPEFIPDVGPGLSDPILFNGGP